MEKTVEEQPSRSAFLRQPGKEKKNNLILSSYIISTYKL